MASVKGLNTVLSNLKKEGANLEECVFKVIQKSLLIGQVDAKKNAPTKDGYLKNGIHVHMQKENTKIQGCLYGTAEYHPYVEFGTGPTGNGTYPYIIKGYTLHYKADKWKAKIPSLISETDSGIRYVAGQVAQPHMYPAMLIVEKNLVNEIRKANGR